MKHTDLIIHAWPDYELLDSGNNRKLERYGTWMVIRPETQALWRPLHPELWKDAHAEFRFAEGKGTWLTKDIPKSPELSWNDIRFLMRLTSFKHTGVFPEQAANWEWIASQMKQQKETSPKILNLFGYTGIASIVAAKAGAEVTHVDASRQNNAWAKENAKLSAVPESQIRYLLDDVAKFVEREVRREAVYDGIILDPPAFGRGAKGEVWHIEEQLARLLASLAKILNKKSGAFFLLNGYAAGYAPQSLLQAVQDAFPEITTLAKSEFGELHLEESKSGRYIPSGSYVRFVR
jgi:23S rRNA (cytosine1962-C5)-methyltransferase